MKIVINEPPRSKKNSMQIIRLGSRYSLTQSKQYKEYKRSCAKYLTGVVENPINIPVAVRCEYYMPTRRRVDLTNLMAATHDLLVDYGILADDNRDIVCSVDGSRVYYDKQHSRTEIEITPYEGEYEVWKE